MLKTDFDDALAEHQRTTPARHARAEHIRRLVTRRYPQAGPAAVAQYCKRTAGVLDVVEDALNAREGSVAADQGVNALLACVPERHLDEGVRWVAIARMTGAAGIVAAAGLYRDDPDCRPALMAVACDWVKSVHLDPLELLQLAAERHLTGAELSGVVTTLKRRHR